MAIISVNKDGKPIKNLRKLDLLDFKKQNLEDAGKVITVGEDGNFELRDGNIKWQKFINVK